MSESVWRRAWGFGRLAAHGKGAARGRPLSHTGWKSALLRVLVAVLIGTLVAAGLAVLAALLLLLATLFFVAIRLRLVFVLLVGFVSHFPSPFTAHDIIRAAPKKPAR